MDGLHDVIVRRDSEDSQSSEIGAFGSSSFPLPLLLLQKQLTDLAFSPVPYRTSATLRSQAFPRLRSIPSLLPPRFRPLLLLRPRRRRPPLQFSTCTVQAKEERSSACRVLAIEISS